MDEKKLIEELKAHLFQLSYDLDGASAAKDYNELRKIHYNNQMWMKDKGIDEEYYNYFVVRLRERSMGGVR